MLTKGLQLGVLRDIYCGQNVAELKQWNCLEQSCTVYCCGYFEKTEPHYRVYEDELDSYQFLQEAWLRGQYPTLFLEETHRLQVASGMEDAFKQACKRKTAQKLRNLIPQELLLGLKEVERLASSDAADNILSLWQEELQGVFRLEALQLFQGAVELAMTQKILSVSLYQELTNWLKRMYQQIDNVSGKKGNLKRCMSGFAYYTTANQWRYFVDAQPLVALKKQQQYQCQGLFTTPVWQKEYYYQRESELPKVRKVFTEELEQYMGSQYLQVILKLWSLPSGVPQEWWEKYSTCTEMWDGIAQKTWKFYTHLWHLGKDVVAQ